MSRFVVFLFGLLGCVAAVPEPALTLYVSPHGNDGWSGALPAPNSENTDGPFATLERARDYLREFRPVARLKAGPIEVRIAGGIYERNASFELAEQDGGSEHAPVIYAAMEGQVARLVGGRRVPGFHKLSDDAIRGRLSPEAREAVVEADLKSLGITDYGTLKRRGFGQGSQPSALELYFDGKPMTLARWPNEGWAKIAAVPAGKDGGRFTYSDDRPSSWQFHDDIWVHGYWTWDWADSMEKVASINKETKEIATVPPHGVYGYKEGARFFAINVLEELDQPGEYFVDRTTGMLYFWPPSSLESAEAWVSLLETPMLSIKGVKHVTVQGLSFEYTRGGGAAVEDVEHVRIADCAFSNIGNYAVNMSGADSGVSGCTMYNLGDGGISISGGDRSTLTPARMYADHNEVHDFSRNSRTYTPAISVNGVGNTVAHNHLYNAPHMAIGLGGNDHVIEYNEVHHVCMETHDAGAFYMGRDWTQRGVSIRYNFFHHLGNGDVQAIYLDDWTSGISIYGNICHGALRAVLIGGGRDNVVDNNIFVDCKIGVHIDQRGIGWAKNYFNGETPTLFERLEAVKGTEPPYTERYPELKTLLEDEPALAKNNTVVRNIYVGPKWLALTDGLTENTPYLQIKDNFTEGDPGFVDAGRLDFRLKPDSPALALGFKPLPFEQMGNGGPSVLKQER